MNTNGLIVTYWLRINRFGDVSSDWVASALGLGAFRSRLLACQLVEVTKSSTVHNVGAQWVLDFQTGTCRLARKVYRKCRENSHENYVIS